MNNEPVINIFNQVMGNNKSGQVGELLDNINFPEIHLEPSLEAKTLLEIIDQLKKSSIKQDKQVKKTNRISYISIVIAIIAIIIAIYK